MPPKSTIQGFRLSPPQKRIWLLRPDEHSFQRSVCLTKITGRVDQYQLRSALRHVVEKYEILRTWLLPLSDGLVPVQVIEQEPRYSLEVFDRTHRCKSDEMQIRYAEEALTPTHDAGLRAVLSQDQMESLLLISVPSFAADYAGLGNIVAKILDCHEGKNLDQSAEDASPQYADISQTLNEYVESQEFYEGQKYWLNRLVSNQLGGSIENDSVVMHRPFSPRAFEFNIHPEIIQQIDQQCCSAGVSRKDFLLSCWQLVARTRIDTSATATIGVAVDGRNHVLLRKLPGVFEKNVPLTQPPDIAGSFIKLMQQTRDNLKEMEERQQFFDWKTALPGNEQASDAYFTWCFGYRRSEQGRTNDLQYTVLCVSSIIDRFHCEAEFIEHSLNGTIGIQCQFQYNSSSITARSAEALMNQLREVICNCATDTQQCLSQVSLIGENEKRLLLEEWNRTETATGSFCIHGLFELESSLHPSAIALEYENTQLTFHELNRRANQLARSLVSIGVSHEVRVALCLERGIEMMVAMLAILKAGGAYVPLDPNYPMDRLDFILKDSACPVLLTLESLKDRLPASFGQTVYLDASLGVFGHDDGNLDIAVDVANLAYVIYTSGSTGAPKGVCITHGAVANFAKANGQALGVNGRTSLLQFASFSFDASVSEWATALLNGGRLVLAERNSLLPGPQFYRIIERHGVNTAILPPSLLGSLTANDLSQIHTLLVAGEVCSSQVVAQWADGRIMKNAYGPTETTVGATISDALSGTDAPIGKPMWNVKVYVLNSNMEICPIEVTGELYIGGSGLARGYLNRPSLTAEKFLPDPFSSNGGQRLYRTGDFVSWRPDGNLKFHGRADCQVKIRGHRIELGEIEAMLCQYPDVKDAVVICQRTVSSEPRLTAFFVGRKQELVDHTEIRKYLKQKLPEYMWPSVYLQLDHFPVTYNGKIDRRALENDPQRFVGKYRQKTEYAPPETLIEKELCQIWAGVISVEKVGRHDNFFELGGDSILGIQVVARAHEAGLQLSPRQIFDYQTVAELAQVAQPANTEKPRLGLATGSAVLTPIQSAFFERTLSKPEHYNQSVLLRLAPKTDPRLLERVIGEVIDRHEIFKARFVNGQEGWEQVFDEEDWPLAYERHDLSALSVAEATEQLQTEAERIQASLDITGGLLLRAAEFDLGIALGRRLLLVVHHLAVDAVSWRIVLAEIETAYSAYECSIALTLPPKTSSVKQWADRLQQYSNEEGLIGEISYWVGRNWTSVRQIPRDYSSGDNNISSVAALSVALSKEQTSTLLQELPRIAHIQINEALIIALAGTLSSFTFSEAVLFSLEGHGREDIFPEINLSRTVGWFTTEFPALLTLSKQDRASGRYVRKLKEQLREIPGRGLGYGVLRYLRSRHDLDLAAKLKSFPAAEVGFNYLGQADTVFGDSELFSRAPESAGRSQPAEAQRTHLLEVEAYVLNESLHIKWSYSKNIHREQTVRLLLDNYLEELWQVVHHSRSSQEEVFASSDFGLANLKRGELKQVAAFLKKT